MRLPDVEEVMRSQSRLEEEAENFGRRLRDKERQVREVLATVLRSEDLAMVKPRVRYQAARHSELRDLAEFVSRFVDRARERSGEEFERAREALLNFLEATVAYARYYGVRR